MKGRSVHSKVLAFTPIIMAAGAGVFYSLTTEPSPIASDPLAREALPTSATASIDASEPPSTAALRQRHSSISDPGVESSDGLDPDTGSTARILPQTAGISRLSKHDFSSLSDLDQTQASSMRVAVADAMRRSWTRPLASVGRYISLEAVLAVPEAQSHRALAQAPSPLRNSSSESDETQTSGTVDGLELVQVQPPDFRPANRPSDPESLNTSNPPLLPSVLVPRQPGIPLSPLQDASWQQMEQDFVARIGETQNPSDPEYRARWQSAQEISDAMFRQKFGVQAFLRYNAEAGRRSVSE